MRPTGPGLGHPSESPGSVTVVALLFRYREDGLEVGGFGFAVHDGGFDVAEAGAGEVALEFVPGEAEPEVGVELAGFLEVMAHEVEHGDTAAGFEDAPGFGDGAVGVLGVVEGLAEEGEVDGAV